MVANTVNKFGIFIRFAHFYQYQQEECDDSKIKCAFIESNTG
jgi:hypothetical protein